MYLPQSLANVDLVCSLLPLSAWVTSEGFSRLKAIPSTQQLTESLKWACVSMRLCRGWCVLSLYSGLKIALSSVLCSMWHEFPSSFLLEAEKYHLNFALWKTVEEKRIQINRYSLCRCITLRMPRLPWTVPVLRSLSSWNSPPLAPQQPYVQVLGQQLPIQIPEFNQWSPMPVGDQWVCCAHAVSSRGTILESGWTIAQRDRLLKEHLWTAKC